MNPLDPNVQSVEAVAQALGDLCDEVVLVGGCAADLVHYLSARFGEIAQHADFSNTLPGLLTYDEIHEDRVRRVRVRIEAIAALSAE